MVANIYEHDSRRLTGYFLGKMERNFGFIRSKIHSQFTAFKVMIGVIVHKYRGNMIMTDFSELFIFNGTHNVTQKYWNDRMKFDQIKQLIRMGNLEKNEIYEMFISTTSFSEECFDFCVTIWRTFSIELNLAFRIEVEVEFGIRNWSWIWHSKSKLNLAFN